MLKVPGNAVPCVQLDHAHLGKANERSLAVCDKQRRMPGVQLRRQLLDARNLRLVRVLLEKHLAGDTVGRAKQR
jgi:hypothetical protein